LGSIGVLASSPIAQGLPMIPLDPPPCDNNGQPPGCVPPASLLLPYFEVDANQPGSLQPKQGPDVSFDKVIGGVVAHITDRSGVAAQCEYKSDFYSRNFSLPAKGTFDLRIVPAIPEFRDWPVNITCDNGTSTNTSTFF
jgi:hypothetical protein